MKKTFKNNLIIRSIFIVVLSLIISTCVFTYIHIEYMLKNDTKYLEQISSDSEELIFQSINSVKESTDLLANDLSKLHTLNYSDNINTLKGLVVTNPFIKRTFITDNKGMQIAKYPSIGNVNIANRDYFKKAIKGEGNFSKIISSTVTGESIIIYCTPIKENNIIIGTLSSILEINSLNAVLNSTTKALQCTFGLLDNKGSLLLSNKKSNLVDNNTLSNNNNKLINLSNLEPVKKLMNNESGSGKFLLNNKKVLVQYRSFKNSNLNLIISIPYEHITKSKIQYILIGIFILIFVLLIAIVLITRFANRITMPIIKLSKILKDFSKGNLNVVINEDILKSGDEFGELARTFNIFSDKIKQIIIYLKDDCNKLNSYSNNILEIINDNKTNQLHISDMMTNVNKNMKLNLDSLKDGLVIFKEFSQGINNINVNLKNVNDVSITCTTSTEEGVNYATNMKSTLDDSLQSLNDINNKISYLTDTSKRVNLLADTINEVAEETNLIALNASIEAVRVGEAGKGFLVVAEQIKKLAYESATSSENINKLLYEIQSEIENTSEIVQEMNKRFNNLVNDTESTFKIIKDIKTKAYHSQGSVEEITSIIEEQTAGIEEGTESLGNVVNYINENANVSLDIDDKLKMQSDKLNSLLDLSNVLNKMSNDMKEAIEFFK